MTNVLVNDKRLDFRLAQNYKEPIMNGCPHSHVASSASGSLVLAPPASKSACQLIVNGQVGSSGLYPYFSRTVQVLTRNPVLP